MKGFFENKIFSDPVQTLQNQLAGMKE